MSWTYLSPESSNRDAVRFLLGDTDSSDPLVSDEELAWLLAQTGEVYEAAARAADHLFAFYSRQADKTVGPLRVSYSQNVEHFRQLARQLRLGDLQLVAPYAGGIRAGETVSASVVPPYFRVGMHVN